MQTFGPFWSLYFIGTIVNYKGVILIIKSDGHYVTGDIKGGRNK